ncbi:hypothetical protein [Prosthecomicrobium pneumaticum]|uniref:Uncharacterized protein (TIGR02588 family) n=1 Tax=Prosthecomicrobium pneumaticum TaxID=81895 RepID=A0A7W9FMA9_9HYPH|nr:hypothetical protein [Prosthecomicrobium pneumaticum]MBB5753269.1 uncharacterized protein (TIGR02588 family) [Prosthecomicrobium pneumaticum]
MAGRDSEGKRDGKAPVGTSPVEWAAAAAGAVLLVATIAYLVHYGLTKPEGPPVIRVVVETVEPAGEGYRVGFTATNEGNGTAAELSIRGVLRAGGAEIEASTARIDFLPQESSRSGGLFFRRDPRALTLDLRAEGYVEP